MPVVIENTTQSPFIAYALDEALPGQPYGRQKWRCVIGNVEDRDRQMQVFNADGIPIPGKTEPIPRSRPLAGAGKWKGRLPSPVAEFTNEQWAELEKSPCFAALDALVKKGDMILRREASPARREAAA